MGYAAVKIWFLPYSRKKKNHTRLQNHSQGSHYRKQQAHVMLEVPKQSTLINTGLHKCKALGCVLCFTVLAPSLGLQVGEQTQPPQRFLHLQIKPIWKSETSSALSEEGESKMNSFQFVIRLWHGGTQTSCWVHWLQQSLQNPPCSRCSAQFGTTGPSRWQDLLKTAVHLYQHKVWCLECKVAVTWAVPTALSLRLSQKHHAQPHIFHHTNINDKLKGRQKVSKWRTNRHFNCCPLASCLSGQELPLQQLISSFSHKHTSLLKHSMKLRAPLAASKEQLFSNHQPEIPPENRPAGLLWGH